jgi:hypothetical protein
LRDIDGPVGDLMRDLATQMADVARAKVRVRIPGTNRTGRTSNSKAPGYTKSSITSTVGHSKLHDNVLFGGAEAPGNPGIFLEAPAEQMHEKYPFLTTGLWSISLD